MSLMPGQIDDALDEQEIARLRIFTALQDLDGIVELDATDLLRAAHWISTGQHPDEPYDRSIASVPVGRLDASTLAADVVVAGTGSPSERTIPSEIWTAVPELGIDVSHNEGTNASITVSTSATVTLKRGIKWSLRRRPT